MGDEARLARMAAAHGVQLVVQFGSTVTGRTHSDSDVDLAVLLDHAPPSLERHGELASDLQACFPDHPVDLAILNHADPLFLKQIFDTARLIYGPIRKFQELRILAFKRYQDHRRFLDLEREVVARRLGAGTRP
jgi:predicted nucleotidyltransferase